ncbi:MULTISPECIES: trans-aconitate 2-methyltransferase [Streptomyces]|uniref:Trans-aconitate 2-methyltransferase n=1 Tax=Streptomyces virginiae TaxID=1961 RepID=A0ABQ3NWG5_STRVG|nr:MULTISPECIES: trans-aconitate 2-methyltransferase [Streptomyces]KOU15483.1 trans-aconitate methyltransferase [Streptomyces sp. WM6349]KOU81342.1 trans-aconitate methyltransferase [Streptomyces sp. XY593]KOU94211.1 trans-aconitate methyltransferase [Streptomyces sp. XY533]KOU98873.1 trans-aconitate methyltransferase [Streptomyces sp. XY511]KOV44889.1 trans-aconitate methyltransferase [Streptomyces sp. H036]
MYSDTARAGTPTSTAPSAPTWDPQQYLRHAGHRTRPFLDLLTRIPELPNRPARIADLGCGPGNVTELLATRWPEAAITGFDLSPEMLKRATEQYAGPTAGGGSLDFRHGDIAGWLPEEPYDLIVSNAALQWVPGHPGSFGAWINGLRPGGTFAFQIPGNFTAPSHALLAEQCDTPRWRSRLAGHGARYIHLLEPAEYLARFTALGCAADVWETTYHQLLHGPDPVLDWVKGTALRPVLTALGDDREAVDAFLTEYRDRLRAAYPSGPRGTVFPFRRIFAVARKEA